LNILNRLKLIFKIFLIYKQIFKNWINSNYYYFCSGFFFDTFFNCRFGSLPFKYLGLWVHWKKSRKLDWIWFKKCKVLWTLGKIIFLSMGGWIFMLMFVLSATSLYYLSVYRLPRWVLHKIDLLRRQFLWAGVDSVHSEKYSLIGGGAICLHKENEVLSVLDLDQMNISLLYK
jgi:hypothetical protein